MSVVFADTFYWIALTLPGDAAHSRAVQVADDLITTEEVLSEYLTFFCASPEHLRREVSRNVEAVLHDPGVLVIPQTHESFLAGFALLSIAPRQGVQPCGLHFDAYDAIARNHGGAEQR